MSFMERVRSWWHRDTIERAQEEADMSPAERSQAEEDFEARKDEAFVEEHLGGPGVDFERDSGPPPDS